MREYGYSADDVLKVTEGHFHGLKISGASTAEAGSVITSSARRWHRVCCAVRNLIRSMKVVTGSFVALAAGMGVARKASEGDGGRWSTDGDKVVPALISQLGVLRDEYAAMPETVSGSITKVENAFMAWVGGVNEASG